MKTSNISVLTAEQKNILTSIVNGESTIDNALFGAGKTFLMVEAISESLQKNPRQKILVTVFTNQLKAEITAKLIAKNVIMWDNLATLKKEAKDIQVEIKTFDSLGVKLYKNQKYKVSNYWLSIGCHRVLSRRYNHILMAEDGSVMFKKLLSEMCVEEISVEDFESLKIRVYESIKTVKPSLEDKEGEDECVDIISEDTNLTEADISEADKTRFGQIKNALKTLIRETITIVEHNQNNLVKEEDLVMEDNPKFEGFLQTSWEFAKSVYGLDKKNSPNIDWKLMQPSMNEFSYWAVKRGWFFIQKYGANWNFELFDQVFIDECQDMSPLNLAVILKYLKKSGKEYKSQIHFIGDPENQEINQWKCGVWDNVLPRILEAFPNIKKHSLTISHRIPNVIVKMLLDMGVRVSTSSQKEGSFLQTTKGGFFESNKNGLVLSQTNVDCLEMVEEAIKNGLRFNLKNNDFTSWKNKDVVFEIGKFEGYKKSVKAELELLMESLYKFGMVREMIEQNKEFINLKMYLRLCAALEKYFPEVVLNQDSFSNFVSEMFDSECSLTISTIHSAKGLEADVVGIYDYALLEANQKESKECLDLYKVAITRTKDVLYNIVKSE